MLTYRGPVAIALRSFPQYTRTKHIMHANPAALRLQHQRVPTVHNTISLCRPRLPRVRVREAEAARPDVRWALRPRRHKRECLALAWRASRARPVAYCLQVLASDNTPKLPNLRYAHRSHG